MFKGAKKEDLRRIASELELCASDKLTVLDFMDLIKNCDRYKNDPDSVHELANLIIEERKYDESQQLELEKIREKSKLDLEIARIRANDKDNNTEIVRVQYFVRGGFVGYRSHASSKHLSPHLPVDELDSSGSKGVALQVQDARVGVGSTKKPTRC
ncbi:uncharacterized protein TNCV_3193081 [Trichonephila clavipes]|nr:uncharacterized protein TNCV_3193081 [Trichonephila clavipes]